MKKVLFVCAGNVFRSMTAELALRAALGDGKDIEVASAGIVAKNKALRADIVEILASHGLDTSQHIPRRVTSEMLSDANIVIAMDRGIQASLEQKFNAQSVLFESLSRGIENSIPDLVDAVPDYRVNVAAARIYLEAAVERMIAGTPALLMNLGRILSPSISQDNQGIREREKGHEY